ncbi:MAG: ribonuclease D [Pseudomonadota bacterium]|nr:ribonuclease D [Pseudomonadota bacterium]
MSATLITSTDELASLCQRLAWADYVTVDTEFMRESTFWPKLCLAQVAGPDDAVAIDALAPGMDLSPLFALLADPDVVKVFHAARQDIEIFHHLDGRIPAPLFDSQVAAMVCGFGDSVSYEALASKLAKARIDKSLRFTDWSHRPLTERQLEYAIDDVRHLRVIYERLASQLERTGRTAWLSEEMAVLNDPSIYEQRPDNAWRRLKSRSTDGRFLTLLREVAGWREREAQTRDLPRNRVVRDESLLDIAARKPATVNDLARTRGVSRKMAEGVMGDGILAAVRKGKATLEADWPKVKKHNPPARGIGPVVELLKVLLKMKCDEYDVAQRLVANTADLEQIASGNGADVNALHGWRRELFGEDALALKAGKLALSLQGNRIHIERH